MSSAAERGWVAGLLKPPAEDEHSWLYSHGFRLKSDKQKPLPKEKGSCFYKYYLSSTRRNLFYKLWRVKAGFGT